MTKIPLGISNYSNLLNILFFIISKTIAIGITEIGQVNLKLESDQLCGRTDHLCGRVQDFPVFVHINQLCDRADHSCGRTLGNTG